MLSKKEREWIDTIQHRVELLEAREKIMQQVVGNLIEAAASAGFERYAGHSKVETMKLANEAALIFDDALEDSPEPNEHLQALAENAGSRVVEQEPRTKVVPAAGNDKRYRRKLTMDDIIAKYSQFGVTRMLIESLVENGKIGYSEAVVDGKVVHRYSGVEIEEAMGFPRVH